MHTVRLIESVRPGESILECSCGKREFVQDGEPLVCGRCGARALGGAEPVLPDGHPPLGELLPLSDGKPQEMVLVAGVTGVPLTPEQQAEWDLMAEQNTAALETMLEAPCHVCHQRDVGQYGEYPCKACGLPRTWDDVALTAEQQAELAAITERHAAAIGSPVDASGVAPELATEPVAPPAKPARSRRRGKH